MSAKKIAHLEMIQGVINRMGSNSFKLKGWSIVLVSALFALSAKDSQVRFAILAALPALVFWFLDGFYLHQEKLFRELYDDVRVKTEDNIDFSMDTRPFRKAVPCWFCICFTRTVWPFHIAVIAAVVAVVYYYLKTATIG